MLEETNIKRLLVIGNFMWKLTDELKKFTYRGRPLMLAAIWALAAVFRGLI